jgi:hypothetical protein
MLGPGAVTKVRITMHSTTPHAPIAADTTRPCPDQVSSTGLEYSDVLTAALFDAQPELISHFSRSSRARCFTFTPARSSILDRFRSVVFFGRRIRLLHPSRGPLVSPVCSAAWTTQQTPKRLPRPQRSCECANKPKPSPD